MKKFIIQIVVLLIAIFAGILTIFNPSLFGLQPIVPGGGVPGGGTTMNSDATYKQVDFADPNSGAIVTSLGVEVADTPAKRGRGLSYRDSMDPNQGMIFLFDAPTQPTFIMTGMRFPLDFIWVLGDRIVGVQENVPIDPAQTPDQAGARYPAPANVDKVIEVNAGYVAEHKLKVGDVVQIGDIRQ